MTEKQDGYRIGWLIPVEALCYGSLLGFGLKFGFLLVTPIVFTLFFAALFIAKKIENRYEIDSVKYHEAINYAIESSTKIPSYELHMRKKTRNNKLYLIRKSLSNNIQSLLLASRIAVLLK